MNITYNFHTDNNLTPTIQELNPDFFTTEVMQVIEQEKQNLADYLERSLSAGDAYRLVVRLEELLGSDVYPAMCKAQDLYWSKK